MALIKLYEASVASTPYGTDTFNTSIGAGWYLTRHDCAIYHVQSGHFYKVYRDGTTIRICVGQGYFYLLGYSADLDLMYTIDWLGGLGGNKYNDAIGYKYNPSLSAPITYTGLSNGIINSFLWQGYYYSISGGTVTKHNMDGSTAATITLAPTITPFSGDRVYITADGILVAIDADNTTYGVVHFYNLYTATDLYTSTIDRAKMVWVDLVHRNVWSIKQSTGVMQTWSFAVAPDNFTSITMGSNQSRYREDALSVTLRGSNNEPVPHWPVEWSLDTAEGHLQETYTETDEDGLAENVYCGPGVDDYVGAAQAVNVSTGY